MNLFREQVLEPRGRRLRRGVGRVSGCLFLLCSTSHAVCCCSWSYYCDNPAQLVPGATAHGMYDILLSRYRHIAKRAAYTFVKKYDGSISRKAEFLAELKADLLVLTHATLIDIFMDALGEKIVSGIKQPGMLLLGPVQEAIKSIPVPGLEDFLALESMLDDVLTGAMTELIESIVAKPLESGQAELSAVSV
jgi:hypothetical protein